MAGWNRRERSPVRLPVERQQLEALPLPDAHRSEVPLVKCQHVGCVVPLRKHDK
jgi:hypothetical protein